jgi:UDP-glucuronate 4-epimerase
VYGGNTNLPFSEHQGVDHPVSLYAASKMANELMAHTHSHLYGLPAIGLRFFTVYGPWGRPNMALFLFTKAILAGEPIQVFNNGQMVRDFTYVDDIIESLMMDYIEAVENALGFTATKEFLPMQLDDVPATAADTSALETWTGFKPNTTVQEGIAHFVTWYRQFYRI